MNQYLVDSPYTPFTIKNQFKAISNGKVYIGEVDNDPLNPSQQIQVYVVDETGLNVPVSQPIQLNAGGYLVYNGQVSKFITLEPYSMVVLNNVNAEMWRVDDISKVDPDNITASNVKDTANGGSVQDFIDNIDQVHTRTFANVDAMLAFNGLIEGQSVKTLGYYAAGDGGGAEYILTNMGVADGNIDHLVGGLIAKLVPDFGVVTAKQVGAVPDNVFAVDNQVKINTGLERFKSVVVDGVFKTDGPIVLRSGYSLLGVSTKESAVFNYNGQKGNSGVDLPTLIGGEGIPTINYSDISSDVLIIPDGDGLQTNDVTISNLRIGVSNRNTGQTCDNNVYATYVNHSTFSKVRCEGAAITSWHSHTTWASTFRDVFLVGLAESALGYPTGTGFSFGLKVTSSGMTSNSFNSCGTFRQVQGWYIARGFYSEISACYAELIPSGGVGFSILNPFGLSLNSCGSEYCSGKMVKVEATTGNSQTITISDWNAVATITSGETFEFRGNGLNAILSNTSILPINPVCSIGTFSGARVTVIGNMPFKESSTGSDAPINFGGGRGFYKHNRTSNDLQFTLLPSFAPFFDSSGVAKFVMFCDVLINTNISSGISTTATQTLTASSNFFPTVSALSLAANGSGCVTNAFSGRINKGDALKVELAPTTLTCQTGAGQVLTIKI